MLEFKELTVQNASEIKHYLDFAEAKTCDYSFITPFMWRSFFHTQYAIAQDMLFFRTNSKKCGYSYLLPVGRGDFDSALNEIDRLVNTDGGCIDFSGVTQQQISILTSRYGDKVECSFDRKWSDYLYLAADLVQLSGRKYGGQRNHINKFCRLYSYNFVQADSSNIARMKVFLLQYMAKTHDKPLIFEFENNAAMEVLDNFDKVALLGGFIEVEGKIVSMAICEAVNETLYIHIEKADIEYAGSYQMIVNQIAINFAKGKIKYINREDDAGDLGLRTSKLSYHPIEIIDKYNVVSCKKI